MCYAGVLSMDVSVLRRHATDLSVLRRRATQCVTQCVTEAQCATDLSVLRRRAADLSVLLHFVCATLSVCYGAYLYI